MGSVSVEQNIQHSVLRRGSRERRWFQNLLYVPVFRQGGELLQPSSLVPLSSAVHDGAVQVTETGRVSSLRVASSSGFPVLALAGSYLQGGRQDRMITSSIVIAEGSSGEVPVRCVEHGRWNSAGQEGAFSVPASQSMVASVVCSGSSTIDQCAVWDTVQDLSVSVSLPNATQRHGQTIADMKSSIGQYTGNIAVAQLPTDAVGCLFVAFLNRFRVHFALDLFATPELCSFYFPQLCESVALSAIAGRVADGSFDYKQHLRVRGMWEAVMHNLNCAHLELEHIPSNAGELRTKPMAQSKSGCSVSELSFNGRKIHTMLRWTAAIAS